MKINKKSKVTFLKLHTHNINFVDLDPREEFVEDQLMHMQDLKMVHIGSQNFLTTKIVTSLFKGDNNGL